MKFLQCLLVLIKIHILLLLNPIQYTIKRNQLNDPEEGSEDECCGSCEGELKAAEGKDMYDNPRSHGKVKRYELCYWCT